MADGQRTRSGKAHRARRKQQGKPKGGPKSDTTADGFPKRGPRPAWQDQGCWSCGQIVPAGELVSWFGPWGDGWWGHPACVEAAEASAR